MMGYEGCVVYSIYTVYTEDRWLYIVRFTLTCSSGGDDFGLAPSSIPLGSVGCHGDRVSGLRLKSTNDGLLQNGKNTKSEVKRTR